MSSALAKIQQSKTAFRAERTIEICLAQGVVKRVQSLSIELADLEVASGVASSADEKSSTRKMANPQAARMNEIRAELEGLYEEMRAATGKVTVAATISKGEWRRWCDEHPAREDGRDNAGRPVPLAYDLQLVAGYCDASALLERVGDFITEWDGEPLAPGQLEFLLEKIHPGDLKQVAATVVGLYEGEGARALPKLPSSGSFETPPSEMS